MGTIGIGFLFIDSTDIVKLVFVAAIFCFKYQRMFNIWLIIGHSKHVISIQLKCLNDENMDLSSESICGPDARHKQLSGHWTPCSNFSFLLHWDRGIPSVIVKAMLFLTRSTLSLCNPLSVICFILPVHFSWIFSYLSWVFNNGLNIDWHLNS